MTELIIAETVQGIYSAIQYASKYCQRDDIAIVVPSKLIEHTQYHCSEKPYRVIALEELLPNKFFRYFFQMLRLLLTNRNFTHFYNRDVGKLSATKRLLGMISTWVPLQFGRPIINRIQSSYSNKFLRASHKICYITPIYHPELISKYAKKTNIIMESWDHFFKSPIYSSDAKILTWNTDLAKDLSRVNNRKFKVSYIKPLKLIDKNQSNEKPLHYTIDQRLLGKLRTGVLYPMALNENDNRLAYLEEIELIKKISSYFKSLRVNVLVKEKPGSSNDSFANVRFDENVEILSRYESLDGIEFLSEDYHRYRFQLIMQARFVLNLSTTFALDTAYSGRGFLQLDISDLDFNYLAQYTNNYHIDKYLLNKCDLLKLSEDFLATDDLLKSQRINGEKIQKWLSCYE